MRATGGAVRATACLPAGRATVGAARCTSAAVGVAGTPTHTHTLQGEARSLHNLFAQGLEHVGKVVVVVVVVVV